MEDLFTKSHYNQNDIELFMSQKIEESLYLDYKSGPALANNKKQEIAKDVSSFANSDGGIIIYGINEFESKPASYEFVDGSEFSKEWIESVIQGNVKRRIPELKIHPVRFDDDIKKTVYVVQIPPSTLAPHMTSFGRFYKRHNFQSVPMEEYEVRNLYSRSQVTELRISKLKFKELKAIITESNEIKKIDYRLYFQVINISNALEEKYKLEINIPKEVYYSKSQPVPNPYLIREGSKTCTLSIPGTSPIFQGELTTMLKLNFELNNNTLKALKNGISVKLYYSNGTAEKTFQPLKTLVYNKIKAQDLKFI